MRYVAAVQVVGGMEHNEGPSDPGLSPEARPDAPAGADPYGLSGQTVSHYAVQDVLGGGGMGVVYRAEDTRLRRTVALKFLPPLLSRDAHAKERFMAEAQAASALDHPNICTVHEIGETDSGQLFIAMAYYPGETLRARLKRGPVPVAEATDLAVQVARGLAKAHAKGIVHRDVKPANVMITPEGRAKLVDFGVAKMADTLLTQAGTTVGTIAYMSPEQTRGEAVDARTDLWALGVVLYEALTGERPFRGAYDQAVVFSILHEDPEPVTAVNPSVPPALDPVIGRCLQKDPARRYSDASALLADLEAVQQGTATQRAVVLSERPTHRRLARLGMGLAVALVLAVGLLLAWPAAQSDEQGGVVASGLRQVAVLPFANVGGDSTNQAFIDGLVYTIGATLTEMEQFANRLSVLPTDDALATTTRAPREAAQTLGADLVVSGSVQRAAERIRLTLEVYDAEADRRLGSRILDKTMTDLLALQDSVALTLASLLDVELNEAAQEALAAGGTTSSRAYDLYTQARGYLQHYEDERNVDRAIALFEQAINEDGRYALAYAGLGEAYWRKYDATNDPRWKDEAGEAGEQAVELDGDLAPVRVTLGLIYKGTGEFEAAEREFLRALTLDSLDAQAHKELAATYYFLGRLDEAEREYRRAIALKPGYWEYHGSLAFLYSAQGRHEEAIPLLRRVIQLRPDNPWGYNDLGLQYHRLGRLDSAAVWYRRATEANPAATGPTALAFRNLGDLAFLQRDYAEAAQIYQRALRLDSTNSDTWAMLGDAYALGGNEPDAQRAFRRMLALDERTLEVNPNDENALLGIAIGHARLGRPERAREALRRLDDLPQKGPGTLLVMSTVYEALNDRPSALHFLGEGLEQGLTRARIENAPYLDALRTDPRYHQLVQDYPPQR
ncbi:MAG: protein kinase [Rhodothermaceae bacterium]|nr:protein kinase [Rhodothermaceae bacterium]